MENDNIVIYEEKQMSKKKSKLIVLEKKDSTSYYDSDIKYFTQEEIGLILSNTDSAFYNMVLMLLYQTGARVEEARNIKFNNINNLTMEIKLLTLKRRTVNKIYRNLKLSPSLLSLVLNHRLTNNMRGSDYILAKRAGGKAVSKVSINKRIKSVVLKLWNDPDHLSKAHSHSLRHSRAIHLLDSGAPITLVKDFLGHASIVNTLVYTKYSNAELRNAIDKSNNQLQL